jgi:anti-sigma regulatory factor (Ser/Thr protein kinase)
MAQDKPEGTWKCYNAAMDRYEEICSNVLEEAEAAGMPQKQQLRLELGLEEILVNIISYAYDEGGKVWVRTSVTDHLFCLEFADHGKPFDPLQKDLRHDDNLPLEEREPGGFGIFLVKKYFHAVEYKYEEIAGAMANHLSLWLSLQ